MVYALVGHKMNHISTCEYCNMGFAKQVQIVIWCSKLKNDLLKIFLVSNLWNVLPNMGDIAYEIKLKILRWQNYHGFLVSSLNAYKCVQKCPVGDFTQAEEAM